MNRHVVLVATLAVLAGAGGWAHALDHDFFPASADGSFNTYGGTASYSEGYGIGGAGVATISSGGQYFAFMGFDAIGDVSQVTLSEFLIGRRVASCALYLRNASASTCDPYASAGTYINDPVTILGFRVANEGRFVDRGSNGNGFSGGAGTFSSPLLEGGENAACAWRMGPPPYSQPGDAGAGAEWYRVSSVDSQHAGQTVNSSWDVFDPQHAGFGGLNESRHFALRWVVTNSDAHIVNSQALNEADCTGYAGEEEPRDLAGDLNYGEGWFAIPLDRKLVQAIAVDPECKGIVLSSVASITTLKTRYQTRDQGDGNYEPYLDVYATLAGDVDLDGCCDVIDLLFMVDTFGLMLGDVNFNPLADLNNDDAVDVVDLLTLVDDFGACME